MTEYINEGANSNIASEFTRIRLDISKDKLAFRKAINDKDYKKARTIAYRINKNCDDFYKKLCDTSITPTEAIVGTAAKAAMDIGSGVLLTIASVEGFLKLVEVGQGHSFTKSKKEKLRKKIAGKFTGDEPNSGPYQAFLGANVGSAVVKGAITSIASVKKKFDNDETITAADLDTYYQTVKNKMKVICAKSKLLINEVDILEKKFGAEKYREKLKKDVEDSKKVFKESEVFIDMDKDLMDIMLESDMTDLDEIAEERTDDDIDYSLLIYEACANGDISEDDREEILERMKAYNTTSSIVNEASSEEYFTKKEKYDEVKRIAYERCSKGEFTEDQREEILKEAYDRIFNENMGADGNLGQANQAAKPDTSKEEAETKKSLDNMNKQMEAELKKSTSDNNNSANNNNNL